MPGQTSSHAVASCYAIDHTDCVVRALQRVTVDEVRVEPRLWTRAHRAVAMAQWQCPQTDANN